MPMHKPLYTRDDIDRIHESRKEGERGLTNIEDSVGVLTQGLEDYIKKSKERLIKSTNESIGNMRTDRTTKTR